VTPVTQCHGGGFGKKSLCSSGDERNPWFFEVNGGRTASEKNVKKEKKLKPFSAQSFNPLVSKATFETIFSKLNGPPMAERYAGGL